MPSNISAFTALEKLDNGSLAKLEVVYKGKPIQTAQYLPKADAQSAPSVSLGGVKSKMLIVMLDVDAPFVNLPVLGLILHWRQSGFTADQNGLLGHGEVPFITDYIGPAPPPLSGPHRYCFFAYEEPLGFDHHKFAPQDGQKVAATKRMWYSLDEFEKEARLGPIIASNYFKSN